MAIPTTSYVLDSRQRTSASSLVNATYNFTALGSPVEAGTYEVLFFNNRNNLYNVDDTNNEIYFGEDGAGNFLVTLTNGYYTADELRSHVETEMNTSGGAGTYTITYDSNTNKYTFTVAGAPPNTFQFLWGDNSAQPLANLLLGFDVVNSVDLISFSSTQSIELDTYSALLINIVEDGLKNVTLVDGTEYSLIFPITSAYAESSDNLKSQTFNQTVSFINSMNNLNVELYNSEGVSLTLDTASPYTLVLRRVF